LAYSNGATVACRIEGVVPGVITGTFVECGGELTQTWTFTDDCSRTITQTQTITIEPAPQAVFDAVGNGSASCTVAGMATVRELAYSNGANNFCSIEGTVVGFLSSDYNDCGGTITQTWTFTDDCGRTINAIETINVDPAPAPVFTAVADSIILCTEVATFAAFELGYSNNADASCLIEGTVTGTLSEDYDACGGTITQTWTYTDDCGRTIDATQTINVEPSPEPVFAAVSDSTIQCTEVATFAAFELGYNNGAVDGCLIEGTVLGTLSED
jgi:hypothetical protein